MATITAAAGGGSWTTGGTWVGGVAPTAADDALLTAASGNVTINSGAVARSLNATGYTGTLTHTAGATLTLGDATAGLGNVALLLVAGMTYTLGSGTTSAIRFNSGSATQQTIATGGKNMGNVSFTGAGSSYLLNSGYSALSGTLTLTAGTLDTNSQTLAFASFSSAGAVTRVLTLGSSTITLSGSGNPIWTISGTGVTLNAGTSTINFTGSSSGMTPGAGLTYSTVTHNGLGSFTLNSSGTFTNFTRAGGGAIDVSFILAANMTVTGTLDVSGSLSAGRLWVRSDTPGTARTITVGTTVTGARVDFEDIVGAGAASWNLAGITEGSGDCGGNSGITFTTPATKFGKAAGNWSSTATWALTSGGAAGAPIPLPQDNVVLDANSGAGPYTMNMQRHCTDLTCTGFTGTLSHPNNSVQRYLFGSMTLGSGMTFSATGNFTFAGRGSHTIGMAGKAFTAVSSRTITIGRFGGTYTLTGNANFGSLGSASSAGMTVISGTTFSASTFNVTTTIVSLPAGAIVNMGSGSWFLTTTSDTSPWGANAATVLNAGTSNIVISGSDISTKNFAGAGLTYYDLTYTLSGSTGALSITGSNTFHTINFSDASNARVLQFTAGTTTTITGDFNVVGTPGKLMTVGSITAANHNLVKTGSGVISKDYLSISRSQASPANTWYAGTHSTDSGNNTGWIFADPPSGNFFLLF